MSSFSLKSTKRRHPAVDDDCYSVDTDYEDEKDDYVEPNPFPGELSFEEDRAAFLHKRKSLPGASKPIWNLIGETSSWRQEDWANAVGKSLPRTPVHHTCPYLNFKAVTEDVELLTEEGPEQPDPGLTVRKNRNIRFNGQPPTRVSERNRNKASQPLVPETMGPVKLTLIDDIYLKLESDPESVDANDGFSSVKSHNDLEGEQDLERIKKRVEADLRGKEKVETTADGQSLPPLKYLSTPIRKYQNFYIDPSQQTTSKPAPTSQLATQTTLPATRRLETQTNLSFTWQVETQTTLSLYEKPQASSSKQINTKSAPTKSVIIKAITSQQTIDTKLSIPT